jgi:hypothetical protein
MVPIQVLDLIIHQIIELQIIVTTYPWSSSIIQGLICLFDVSNFLFQSFYNPSDGNVKKHPRHSMHLRVNLVMGAIQRSNFFFSYGLS